MKIFVSYSRRDAGDFANQINRHLSSFKYNIFTDVDSIRAGEIWSNTIEENISNCDIFVVIVTYGALQSHHVEDEVLQAQREKKKIIPCFFKNINSSKIRWGLEKIQGLEFANEYQLARELHSKIDVENYNRIENEKSSVISQQKTIQETNISEDIDTLNAKGIALYKQGNYYEAIEWFNMALMIDPNHANALNNKGQALSQQGKYEEAMKYYDKALGIAMKQPIPNLLLVRGTKPNYILNAKGIALYKQGKYNEAIEWFNMALMIDPNHANALNNKGLALEHLGKHGEALEYFDKAKNSSI